MRTITNGPTNSDYEMDQIERRVAKYVRESGFIANNTERITMMENCYERARAEKMRVIYHAGCCFPWPFTERDFGSNRLMC